MMIILITNTLQLRKRKNNDQTENKLHKKNKDGINAILFY